MIFIFSISLFCVIQFLTRNRLKYDRLASGKLVHLLFSKISPTKFRRGKKNERKATYDKHIYLTRPKLLLYLCFDIKWHKPNCFSL